MWFETDLQKSRGQIRLQILRLTFEHVPWNVSHQIHKAFDDFGRKDCYLLFRTKKENLPLLLRAFRLNRPKYYARNGSYSTNEELLMIDWSCSLLHNWHLL